MSYTRGTAPHPGLSIDTWHDSAPTFGGGSNTAWGTANMAIYCPLLVTGPCVVRKFWYSSASTAATGNVSMALYAASGTQVIAAVNGAKASSNIEVVVDVTDTFIPAGLYYLGISSDSATDTFFTWAGDGAPIPAAFGFLTEASAYPLPTTPTWVHTDSLAFRPVCGMLLEATAT